MKKQYDQIYFDLDLLAFLLTGGKRSSANKLSDRKVFLLNTLGPADGKTPDGKEGWSAVKLSAILTPMFSGGGSEENKERLRKLKADADYSETKAAMGALGLAKEREELFEAGAVRDFIAALGSAVKAGFGGLGSALALQVSALADPREVEAAINTKVNAVLASISSDFANYKIKNKKTNENTEEEESDE